MVGIAYLLTKDLLSIVQTIEELVMEEYHSMICVSRGKLSCAVMV